MISFLLNDTRIDIEEAEQPHDQTLLNYLRDHRGLTGTKEGCASGDCGACTVVLAERDLQQHKLRYTPINSCVTYLSALQGKQLLTVEHLAEGETLHPVQQAMVEAHGSQCGFCTPGFVMSLFALFHSETPADRHSIDIALSGNLCRCTGYRPIIDAAMQSCKGKVDDTFSQKAGETYQALEALSSKGKKTGLNNLHVPTDRETLRQLLQTSPDAMMFAGSTDVALETTQKWLSLSALIDLSHMASLRTISSHRDYLEIGAAATLSELEAPLLQAFPALSELLWRFASTPIRNQATAGGNVANASPIGDLPPVLLALDAEIVVDNGEAFRTIPARQFFTGYRKTALRQGEWIHSLRLPTSTDKFSAYKVSKRHEDDISAVCAVFNVTLEDGCITALKTGFGGVAATPAICQAIETGLIGKPFNEKSTMETGRRLLADAFTPIDDVRATAAYRQQIVQNLWQRFWLEYQAEPVPTRVVSYA